MMKTVLAHMVVFTNKLTTIHLYIEGLGVYFTYELFEPRLTFSHDLIKLERKIINLVSKEEIIKW